MPFFFDPGKIRVRLGWEIHMVGQAPLRTAFTKSGSSVVIVTSCLVAWGGGSSCIGTFLRASGSTRTRLMQLSTFSFQLSTSNLTQPWCCRESRSRDFDLNPPCLATTPWAPGTCADDTWYRDGVVTKLLIDKFSWQADGQ
jgi:hypothetical protein